MPQHDPNPTVIPSLSRNRLFTTVKDQSIVGPDKRCFVPQHDRWTPRQGPMPSRRGQTRDASLPQHDPNPTVIPSLSRNLLFTTLKDQSIVGADTRYFAPQHDQNPTVIPSLSRDLWSPAIRYRPLPRVNKRYFVPQHDPNPTVIPSLSRNLLFTTLKDQSFVGPDKSCFVPQHGRWTPHKDQPSVRSDERCFVPQHDDGVAEVVPGTQSTRLLLHRLESGHQV